MVLDAKQGSAEKGIKIAVLDIDVDDAVYYVTMKFFFS